ncbi:olfactory receptor 11A1-like [Poecilia reticulata]|uniref:olfactory receptor 11A1-like n=1 Tax=Poecilia reticulata TaxID=8081 RepID=UPI0007EBF125|nr:PREDICTED: olfactory receptor 11A1-like [Poecilia reticulata]
MVVLQTKLRMKLNSSQVLYFTLTAYVDSGWLKYFCFLIVLCLYVLIIGSNVLLIAVICVNRSLHEPMFLFLCSLFVNELLGSLGLFPFLLVQILSDVHIIPAPLCLLQIFCIYTYASVEFTNLAVMSYDRYVAICRPLQYNSLMTSQRIVFLVLIIWLPPCLAVGGTTFLSSSLQLCGNVINKIYCSNHSIIRLTCNDPTANNVYELVMTFLTVCVPVSVILYTYLRILQVCFSGSKQTRQKAVSTCTPHLASIINFSFGVSFEILQSRFNMDTVPGLLRILLSLYFLTCQPVFNPVLYGLNMSRIRSMCKKLLLNSVRK